MEADIEHEWLDPVAAAVRRAGCDLPDEAVRGFARHLALLEKWNRAFNLTAVRDRREMIRVHLLDSLSVLGHVSDGRLLDVGTGAGFPGLTLAIARPALDVTLLDSNSKKIRFVRQAVLALGLGNAASVHERMEDYRPNPPFDTVMCRALATVSDFVSGARHLCRPGGRLLAMKGADPAPELSGLPADIHVEAVHRLEVPGLDAERHLVEMVRAQDGDS